MGRSQPPGQFPGKLRPAALTPILLHRVRSSKLFSRAKAGIIPFSPVLTGPPVANLSLRVAAPDTVYPLPPNSTTVRSKDAPAEGDWASANAK